MAIVSSTFSLDGHAQRDGRRYVREVHTDSHGVAYTREYGPVGVIDYQATATAYGQVLAVQLADAEAAALIG